jgi:hypothetical protein
MTSTEPKRADALQFIFSLFLGMLLVVVVGVGVWTFYPQPFGPNSAQQERLDELYREQENVFGKGTPSDLSSAQQKAEAERIQDEIEKINDEMSEQRDAWAVNTSIILLTFATTLMAISLFLPEHMKVFSNGILLGGLFTVVYGTGWSFAGGDSRARFFVVLVALLLSLAFGYLRFIRGRREQEQLAAVAPTAVGDSAMSPDLGELTARVAALEARATAAAQALGGERDEG